MANQIQKLQAVVAQQREALAQQGETLDAIRAEVLDLRAHLMGPKFQGFEPDGSRRDWIATADVQARLTRLLLLTLDA